MLKVVLVGYGEMASSLMLGVLESRHKVVGILRWEKTEQNAWFSGIKNFLFPDNLESLIKYYKIHQIKVNSVNSEKFRREILKLEADVIIVGSWGEILKKETIISPKIACVNCHPSLLPKYRGSNPYVAVLMNGETKTGITFHLIDEQIDTGPILLQQEIIISDDDTGKTLRTKCCFVAREKIQELLDGLESAKFLPQRQDNKLASYYSVLRAEDVQINWSKTAKEIYNQIRALYPWTRAYTKYKDMFFMIKSAKIVPIETNTNKAGKILNKNRRNFLVSTGDPNNAILLENIQVFGFWNRFLTEFYIKDIKKGNFFIN